MQVFLNQYQGKEIILFIFIFLVALKECLDLMDYYKNRDRNRIDREKEKENKENSLIQSLEVLNHKIDKLETQMDEQKKNQKEFEELVKERFEDQDKNVNLLINSNKDEIKGWIVREYHYFCEQRGWIDDFQMDTIEKRYSHYDAMGGNSYIEDLMNEIKKLPKQPPKKN